MIIIIYIEERETKYRSRYGDFHVPYFPAVVWNAFALFVKMVAKCVRNSCNLSFLGQKI